MKIPYILAIDISTQIHSKGEMTYALLVIITALAVKQNSLLGPLQICWYSIKQTILFYVVTQTTRLLNVKRVCLSFNGCHKFTSRIKC